MSGIHPLTIEAATRRFGDQTAVDSASLTLNPGEITALVGPSGSGKTTFLRLLAGMERLDAGEIQSGPNVLANATTHIPIEQRKIGLVFQDFALFPHMTVLQNVTFGLRHLSKLDRIKIAEQWIDRLGLSHRKAAYPHHLSGGEQQRTAIARALAPEPVAILLDEPFSGLDPSMRDRVRDAALGIVRSTGIPALLVTHDASEALVHADKIAVINDGRILQTGSPSEVYQSPRNLDVARALGPIHSIAASELPGEWRARLGTDAIEFWYRPEAIVLGSGTSLVVDGSKLAGPITELSIALNENTQILAACQPGAPLQVGDQVSVSINPALFFDFTSKTT
ncbi:MAG: ABC transporter ATP-binding protein [Pseudomonadota bacterium]